MMPSRSPRSRTRYHAPGRILRSTSACSRAKRGAVITTPWGLSAGAGHNKGNAPSVRKGLDLFPADVEKAVALGTAHAAGLRLEPRAPPAIGTDARARSPPGRQPPPRPGRARHDRPTG